MLQSFRGFSLKFNQKGIVRCFKYFLNVIFLSCLNFKNIFIHDVFKNLSRLNVNN